MKLAQNFTQEAGSGQEDPLHNVNENLNGVRSQIKQY
jgi:hypothetical protein